MTPWWMGLLQALLLMFAILEGLVIAAILVAFPVIAVRHLLWLRRRRRAA